MKVILNVRLDLKCGSSLANQTERAKKVIEYMRYIDNLVGLSFERIQRQLELDDEYLTCEDLLVIKFNSDKTFIQVNDIAQKICMIAKQDCLAAYFPELGGGKIIGPLADYWPPFTLSEFIL